MIFSPSRWRCLGKLCFENLLKASRGISLLCLCAHDVDATSKFVWKYIIQQVFFKCDYLSVDCKIIWKNENKIHGGAISPKIFIPKFGDMGNFSDIFKFYMNFYNPFKWNESPIWWHQNALNNNKNWNE